MSILPRHALPLSFVSRNGAGPKEVRGASAGLLWVDRPFAVTSGRVLADFLARTRGDDTAEIRLGGLALANVAARVLFLSSSMNLATLSVHPDELEVLDDDVSFYNPLRWPPRPFEEGEELGVIGYPRDQWPAPLRYTFRAEAAGAEQCEARLIRSEMPGRLDGICGAPVYHLSGVPEFIGVVVDSMFHNELICIQHARSLDGAGRLVATNAA